MKNKKNQTVMINFDLLATYIQNKLEDEDLSLRKAAKEIGCSPATLTRLLAGSENDNVPDSANLIKVTSWLGRSLSDFENNSIPKKSTLADVEVHLRALPDLDKTTADAIVGMVKAAYDSAKLQKK